MIKIENTEVFGWEAAIRGMRNPMNSWHLSDSGYCKGRSARCDTCLVRPDDDYAPCYFARETKDKLFVIGKNDLKLMRNLGKAGAVHGKYLRMINVTCDITCNHVWWAEFDTYKIGTVRNSCSKMHKIHVKEFVKDDFSHEGIDECGGRTTEVFEVVLVELERLRKLFNETQEKKYWRAIIELLPMGYNIKATVQLNYEVLRGMYEYRKNHKMFEWIEFCKWVETLPYFKEVLLDA